MSKVTIVGAGLSGLIAAIELQKKGVEVEVLEKSDRPGGQVKTDEFEGFKLDHGFQVYLSGYPTASKFIKNPMRTFNRGAFVFKRNEWVNARHLMTLSDYAVLLKAILNCPLKENAKETIEALGFSRLLTEWVIKPFFRGVLIDPNLSGPADLIPFTLKMFAKGKAALPENGMGSIALSLASQVKNIRYQTEVSDILPNTIIATDPWTAAKLLKVPSPSNGRVMTTYYYSTKKVPLNEPYLMLNGEEGLINHLAPLSLIEPSYAPKGMHLMSVNILMEPVTEGLIRQNLLRLFGQQVESWHYLKSYTINNAHPVNYPIHYSKGIVAGSYTYMPSIEYAVTSGIQAANKIMEK